MNLYTRRAALMGGVGLVGATALAACGGHDDARPDASESQRSSATSSSGVGAAGPAPLPAYQPYSGLAADLPALPDGTAPYYAKYPATPPKFTSATPGNGGSFSALTIVNNAARPLSSNQMWQQLNRDLGSEYKYSSAPIGDYPAKFQTTIAGGDLPDVLTVLPSQSPGLPDLLKAKFQDLSEFLSGEAVKEYPALANIPTYAWEGTVYNDGIYFLPIQRPALYRAYVVRADLLTAAGVDPQPKSGDDFMAILKALTDPKKNRWATGSVDGLLDTVNAMMGTPNSWAVDSGGKFTKDYETDQYRAALSTVAKIWKDGWIHPDAFATNIKTQLIVYFTNGTAGFLPTPASWATDGVAAKLADPKEDPVAFTLPRWEGGGWAKNWLTDGAPYLAGLKKASQSRIQELLRILNYIAAPWGTAEYILVNNGVAGHDYTVQPDGTFKQTDDGKAELLSGLRYSASAPIVHYAQFPEIAKAEYESEKAGMQNTAPLPTVGLESPTDQSKNAQLTTALVNLQWEVVRGQKSVKDWDAGVSRWRSSGGDAIRAEYEAAWAKKNHS